MTDNNPDYREVAVADLKAGKDRNETVDHWHRRVEACVRIIERLAIEGATGLPGYGLVPGDGWAAPETYADHPLHLVPDPDDAS